MENSERPAFVTDNLPVNPNFTVLTKREFVATQIAQGFLAGYYDNVQTPKYMNNLEEEIRPQVCDIILWADELIKQLDDEK